MSVPALWTKHRPLALMLARDYYLPGSDTDDVRQEAMIALWEAARTHDPERSSFPNWARVVIRRHLSDCVRVACSQKQKALDWSRRDMDLEESGGVTWIDRGDQGEVRRIVALAKGLTQPERAALTRIIDGSPLEGKADDNLRYRVRKKLRAAA